MRDDHPNVRIPPPLIVRGLLALGLSADARLFHSRLNPVPFALGGTALVLAGLVLGIAALGLFRRAGTKPEPWKASAALVTGGVYRTTRNPMYLGMMLIAAGLALTLGGLWSALALVAIFAALNFYVIAREEAYLEHRFGEAYRTYRSRVRRWF